MAQSNTGFKTEMQDPLESHFDDMSIPENGVFPAKDGHAWNTLNTACPDSSAIGMVSRPTQAVSIMKDPPETEIIKPNPIEIDEKLRLIQARKMEAIGQLASGISHDFNNILGGILGYAEVLKKTCGPHNQKYAEKIVVAVSKAAELIRQLLNFSRKGNLKPVPINIHESINQVVCLLNHVIDKRIIIKTQLLAFPSVIYGEMGQIENMLLNLALNARDALSNGGFLRFETEIAPFQGAPALLLPSGKMSERFLKITVSDTGCGMDEETQKHIFEPFFTTKAPGKGTGLGLASVHGCVLQHNGRIAIKSRPGLGTAFYIYLPLPADRGIQPTETEETSEPVKGTGHVLVIDDEEDIRESACAILSMLGYTTTCCANGVEAVEFYARHSAGIHAVILDLNMPVMGGIECFRKLKEINPGLIAVITSGAGDSKEAEQVIRDGGKARLYKPFRATVLAQTLAVALAEKKL